MKKITVGMNNSSMSFRLNNRAPKNPLVEIVGGPFDGESFPVSAVEGNNPDMVRVVSYIKGMNSLIKGQPMQEGYKGTAKDLYAYARDAFVQHCVQTVL